MKSLHREKEEWERRRWYLTKSLFQDLEPLTPIHEAADEIHSDSSESLPDLIVQVVPKRMCSDDAEESYQELENIIKMQLKRDADITSERLLRDTEVPFTRDLEETLNNEDSNSQERSINSLIEAMRCPVITSFHHTVEVPEIHHSMDSPQTPRAFLKISSPTHLPLSRSSTSTDSSPKRVITPSPTYSSSESPTTSNESSSKTFSPLPHSLPKTLPSPTELSSKRQTSRSSTSRRSSRMRSTSVPSPLAHSSPKSPPLSTELSPRRQLSLNLTSRRSSRKCSTSVPSPLRNLPPTELSRRTFHKRRRSFPLSFTHSSPKRQTRSVLSLTNSPPQLKETRKQTFPRRTSRKSTKHSHEGLSRSDANRDDVTCNSPILSSEIPKAPLSSGLQNNENSLRISQSNNQLAAQSYLDKAIQTDGSYNNQLNMAVQTSPIEDDSSYNFWKNIFVGEPVIYDILPRTNLN